MDPINPLDRLAAMLRNRVANEPLAKGKVGKAAGGNNTPAQARTAERGASPEALRKRIESSIEAIDPDDPACDKKAARVFAENVLTWQFGENLINDSGFAALVEEVQNTFEKEPGFHATLLTALRQDKK